MEPLDELIYPCGAAPNRPETTVTFAHQIAPRCSFFPKMKALGRITTCSFVRDRSAAASSSDQRRHQNLYVAHGIPAAQSTFLFRSAAQGIRPLVSLPY